MGNKVLVGWILIFLFFVVVFWVFWDFVYENEVVDVVGIGWGGDGKKGVFFCYKIFLIYKWLKEKL